MSMATSPGRDPDPFPVRVTDPRPVTVLYIGGAARSGSTLLDRILDQIPGICAVGELGHLWRRGLSDNELCGCGNRFAACPFWSAVGDAAFGGWDTLDPAELLSLQRTVDRNRFIPLMLRPGVSVRYDRALRAYGRRLGGLYRGIAHASGARVVVDSTKNASTAFLLCALGSIDLRLVHLIRDSRGVAYSCMKRVPRPEVVSRRAYMPSYHPARTSARWVVYNSLFHRLTRLGVPLISMRYEDLVARPRREVVRVLRLLGVPVEATNLAIIGEDAVELSLGHSVAGNPMRFRQGRVPVHLDDAWRTEMRPRHRALVSAMTWPLLSQYGYAKPPEREDAHAPR